jgi:hypothetical protein
MRECWTWVLNEATITYTHHVRDAGPSAITVRNALLLPPIPTRLVLVLHARVDERRRSVELLAIRRPFQKLADDLHACRLVVLRQEHQLLTRCLIDPSLTQDAYPCLRVELEGRPRHALDKIVVDPLVATREVDRVLVVVTRALRAYGLGNRINAFVALALRNSYIDMLLRVATLAISRNRYYFRLRITQPLYNHKQHHVIHQPTYVA